MRFSQIESRFICKYMRQKYGVSIRDTLSFWRMTPEDVQTTVEDLFDLNMSIAEILKAARA